RRWRTTMNSEHTSFADIFDPNSDINPDKVRSLVATDHSIVSKRDAAGDTLLHHVAQIAERDLLELVDLLLRMGADVNAVGYSRETPLHRIVDNWHSGSPEAAELMIRFGADITAVDVHGSTALDRARRHHNLSVLNVLELAEHDAS